MFGWLKSKLKGPQPAGPPQTLRAFGADDPAISRDTVTPEGGGWRIEGMAQPHTVRLFEVADPGVEQCMLTYRAQLKSDSVQGKAYLEMWCRLPGQGEFFSKGFHNAIKGTHDWSSCEIPFYLKQGQQPDLIKLNLTMEGTGTVWIKDVELLQTPLQ